MGNAQHPSTQAKQADTLERQFKEAVAAYEAHNLPEATTKLERLLPQVPSSFEVHELLGLVYAAQSHDEKAVEQLQLAAELNPASAAASSNLANGLVHVGRLAKAEVECRRALSLAPHDYDANHTLAELYVETGKVAEAIPFFEEAHRARPAAYNNGYDLALAYLLAGRLTQADELVGTLEKERDSGELHNLHGRINEKEGKFVDAANQYSVAAHMDPSEENLFVWASELLLHRTYVPAIEVFRQGTQRYPKSARLLVGLGMTLYSRGEYDESIRSLLAAADLTPRDPRCYLFLSKAYLSSPTQAKDVIEHFRRYAELEPGNARAQYYYAVSLWKGGRIENPDVNYYAVESLLQRSIAIDDTSADAHFQLGVLYTDQHEYDKSFPEYQRASQLDPNLPDVHFRLGRYYLHAGDKSKAQSEFDLFRNLQAQHQADIDKERAEVQQFVVSTEVASPARP